MKQAANRHTWYARDGVSHQPLERLEELNGYDILPFAAGTYRGTVNLRSEAK